MPPPRQAASLDQGLDRSTLAIVAGRGNRLPADPLNAPLVPASAFRGAGERSYARDGNPTWEAFEDAIGSLDGGTAVAFATGMAAAAGVIEALPPTARVVVARSAYVEVRRLLAEREAAGRLRVIEVDATDGKSILPALPGADVVWLDSISNPGLDVAEVDTVTRAARQAGCAVVVDSTLATPVNQRPLELGADLVIHSARFEGRLALAGSMAVYGEGRYRCGEHGVVAAPPRDPDRLARGEFEPLCERCGSELEPAAVPEDAAPDPRNVYAATKLHQEHLCAAWARESGASAIALRYHNVYGPRMPRETPYAGVASIFRSAVAAGRAPLVFEDGGQIRDFVHVADVARANLLALDAPPDLAGAFNIASGTPRTVGELAAELARALAGPEPTVTGDFRLGDVRHVFASTERAERMLGFEARVGFAAGVAEFATAPLRAAV